MYYNSDQFDMFPDSRDPVTGDWLPLSESDKARVIRSEDRKMSNIGIASMLTSILK